jgi:pimeloyl-ACP methyl ester carboxylesterase
VGNDARLILLPGLGADERMYAPQRGAFPHLEVPRWVTPRPRESLPDYARRMAAQIDTSDPFFLGGSSFGGMVALEMARHARPRAVFLIGSCRAAAASVPWMFRVAGRLANLAPGPVLRTIHRVNSRFTFPFGDLTAEQHDLMVAMMRDADPRFIQWGGWALCNWAGAGELGVPVHQIHGGADRIMPCRRSAADVIVPGAGHLLNVTHADVVNTFLAHRLI